LPDNQKNDWSSTNNYEDLLLRKCLIVFDLINFFFSEINKVRKCMVNAMKRTNTCTEKHIDTLITHSETLSGSALKLACKDYGEDSPKCDSLKGALPARRKNQPLPKSLLLPIIDLIESIQ